MDSGYTGACLEAPGCHQAQASRTGAEMATNGTTAQAPRRDNQILDLAKYVDQAVRVKFFGGREVHGILKGYDQLVNLVLDDCVEFIRDPNDEYRVTDATRKIGLVVCRGTSVTLVSPVEGTEEISNPFLQQDE